MKIGFSILVSTIFGLNTFGQLDADFSATPLTACVGTPVNFTDLSTGSVVSWAWNFGDGNISSLENPTHTYSAAGTYNITLTVSNGTTSVAEVKASYITINPLPNVAFTTPANGCVVPYAPVFGAVSPASGPYSYSWNFGNGQISTAITPTIANYTSTGTYTVNLTVTNTSTGCVNSVSHPISVFDFSTEFSVSDLTVCVGELVTFTDESVGANNWSWNFGNGASSGSQNPALSYATAGTYTVTLNSQNTTNGCSGTFTQTIVVNPLPQPSFTGDPTFGCFPLVVDFTNTSAGSGTFNWNFGNGSTFSGSNPPNQTYTTEGEFDVSLTMTDANGCSKTVTLNDYIVTEPLVSDFEADVYDGCEDLVVQFTDLSSSPNPTDNPITGWSWNFGNGNTFSGQNPPAQTYPEGVYDVTLTVTTAGGCTETFTLFDSIMVGIPPDPGFTSDPFDQCAKTDFYFTNTTPIPPGYGSSDIVWEWDFGDGGTSDQQNPTYNYPNDTGYFDVELTVYFRGCKDSVVVTDAVYIIAPISKFNPEQSVFCNPTLPVDVDFADVAILGETTDNVEMVWHWGDGDSDILVSPALFNPGQGSMTHTYTGYGTYTVMQVVTNFTTGCADTTTKDIHLSQIDAQFIMPDDSVCRGFPVTMNNASTSTHPITFYLYDLDNDTTLIGPNQTFTYTISDDYIFTLQIINDVGCSDIQVQNLTVLQEPVAGILPSESAGCAPLNVVFTNTSATAGNGAPPDTFHWTFEDGSTTITTDISQTTNYNFTANGTFVTSMFVTDEFGCVSPLTTVTTEITTPTAAFVLEPVVCNQETFTADNTSVAFASSEWFLDGAGASTTTDYSGSFNEANPSGLTGIPHQIMLVVTDVNGCTDTLETTITVSFPQIDAGYTFSGSNVNGNGDFTCPPVFADLTDNSTSFGAITQWQWDFGDDNSSTLQNPANTYVFAGTYTATLTVTDEFGCSASAVFPDYLTIGGPSGEVDWVKIGDACNPEYLFTVVDAVSIASIQWNLGDMHTISSTEDFTYVYNLPGTYLPTALLKDEFNCVVFYEMDLLTTLINVIHADFTVDPMTLPVYDPMLVSDSSYGGSGGVDLWSWQFGDDGFSLSSGADFTYEWQQPGFHDVTLIVTDTLGCKDTMTLSVLVTAELFIPNVFTADNDGINDVFVMREPVFTTYDVLIVNRWGKVISESVNQNGVYLWDGRDKNGDMSTQGTYFYKIEGLQYDGQVISTHGAVTLIRIGSE